MSNDKFRKINISFLSNVILKFRWQQSKANSTVLTGAVIREECKEQIELSCRYCFAVKGNLEFSVRILHIMNFTLVGNLSRCSISLLLSILSSQMCFQTFIYYDLRKEAGSAQHSPATRSLTRLLLNSAVF